MLYEYVNFYTIFKPYNEISTSNPVPNSSYTYIRWLSFRIPYLYQKIDARYCWIVDFYKITWHLHAYIIDFGRHLVIDTLKYGYIIKIKSPDNQKCFLRKFRKCILMNREKTIMLETDCSFLSALFLNLKHIG